MTKYFCDFCDKETPRDKLKLIVICDNLRSDRKEYYDICKDCLDKIYEMIEDKRLGEKNLKNFSQTP